MFRNERSSMQHKSDFFLPCIRVGKSIKSLTIFQIIHKFYKKNYRQLTFLHFMHWQKQSAALINFISWMFFTILVCLRFQNLQSLHCCQFPKSLATTQQFEGISSDIYLNFRIDLKVRGTLHSTSFSSLI